MLCGTMSIAQAQVVISQVYGGGGNGGAPLRSDYIELHNNSASTVSLDGWSVQYASSTGTSWQVTPLTGSIAAGAYYLVKQADGANTAAPALPTPDATGTIPMAAGAGKVALSNSATALAGACPAGNIDFVGFGTAANCAEGSAPTATLNATTAALRADNGCTDSNNNAADFAVTAPAPRNGASAALVCGGGGLPILSVADLSQDEASGNFVFTLTLTQPAGAGGVSVDYATADGTAQAGSDYTAASGTVTIAEGADSAQVVVAVSDDSVQEADETFFLGLGNISSGALLGDAQAQATVVNDDVILIPIHSIQGNGATSPFVNQLVSTTGIVTGRKSNGFFIQTSDADAD
ncbi:MAG TPA: Calx-beta domain-containing protein, partial [Pseudoxanthomonas sp.]|nr:Calx-beta domain-containing protein [Pseudoxanthomonas sp.]